MLDEKLLVYKLMYFEAEWVPKAKVYFQSPLETYCKKKMPLPSLPQPSFNSLGLPFDSLSCFRKWLMKLIGMEMERSMSKSSYESWRRPASTEMLGILCVRFLFCFLISSWFCCLSLTSVMLVLEGISSSPDLTSFVRYPSHFLCPCPSLLTPSPPPSPNVVLQIHLLYFQQ